MAGGVKKRKNKKQDILESTREKPVKEKAVHTENKGNCKENIADMNYKKEEENNTLSIEFKSSNLMDAVIYSEILGKPKSRRRGRWR